MKKTIAGWAVVSLLVSTGSMNAHHSYSSFDWQHLISIEGSLERIQFVNPHVMLTVKTADDLTYHVEWGAVAVLARGGVTADSLKAGNHIIVSGAPKKDPTDHTMSLITEVRRPADGWYWSIQRRGTN